MTLAYPGQSGSLCNIMARDAFLEALDPQLRLKILERDTEPVTLEDALRVASRLEAVRKTADVEELKKREKNIRGAIRPIASQLMAVNKSPIEIIGTVTWQLTFGRQTLPVKFEVTNVVDEAILGTKFLFGCECEWEFAEKRIRIAGETVQLQGRKVVVRSDHSALLYLRRSPELIGQQARWLDFLENFDLVLEHREGARHANADSLSRRPCAQTGPCKQCKMDSVELLENETETTGAVASQMSDARLQAVTTRQRAGPPKQNESGAQPGDPPPPRPARPPGYENVNDKFPTPGSAEPARPTRPPDVTVSNRSNEPCLLYTSPSPRDS